MRCGKRARHIVLRTGDPGYAKALGRQLDRRGHVPLPGERRSFRRRSVFRFIQRCQGPRTGWGASDSSTRPSAFGWRCRWRLPEFHQGGANELDQLLRREGQRAAA